MTGKPHTRQHSVTRDFLSKAPPVAGKTVADIGCGDGFATAEFVRLGASSILAVDPDASVVKRLRAKGLGRHVNVLCSRGEDAWRGTAKTFDVVWCHHVLEHQERPVDFLKGLRQLLKKDGMLWLAVPNMGCYDFFVPGHIMNFNMPTLVEMLRLSGYNVRDGSYWGFRGQLRAIVGRWEKAPALDESKWLGPSMRRGLSPYPAPMAEAMKKTGRCTGAVLRSHNWPGVRITESSQSCTRCGIGGAALASMSGRTGVYCKACRIQLAHDGRKGPRK